MDEIEKSLQDWGQQLENVHLPRWHELPDIELYMDQVITLIEKYLSRNRNWVNTNNDSLSRHSFDRNFCQPSS